MHRELLDLCLTSIFFDTEDSKPVCCHQLVHGIHERNIMNTHIQILEENDWISDCEGPWDLLLVLAPKPH